MNDEQIAFWRKTLSMMIGPYALIMPESEIVAIRDNVQRHLDSDREKRARQIAADARIQAAKDRAVRKQQNTDTRISSLTSDVLARLT